MKPETHDMHATIRATPRLRGRRLALAVALALGSLASGTAMAGVATTQTPTGGQVVGGAGSITQRGIETIVKQRSQLMAIDWKTFDVGKDASVLFKQPSVRAIALNRILDQDPSRIFGKIASNGSIFLINTHGIIFGAGARLNVGSLVASTLDLTPDDFLKRNFTLNAHGGHAGIVNHGIIAAASGGSVTLLGGHVVNNGLILADYGRINLGGADKAVLDFDGNGLIHVEITGKLKQRLESERAAVVNNGTLNADAGTVVLKASAAQSLFTNLVNNTGVIKAGGISTAGGVVRLVGTGGNTINSGSIDVSGARGGTVQMLSDKNVGVTDGRIDASGIHGGGSIRVGGGWQGGEGLQTASATYVAPSATLDASAISDGNGGSVVVWGDHVNNFYGSISARGGALGGHGGRVETSSHRGLNARGSVDASAPNGVAGLWLLDPYDVTIDATGGTLFNNPFTATGNSHIKNTAINAALTSGTTVSIFTGAGGSPTAGDITVSAPIQASGTGTLSLKAAGSIFVNADISGYDVDALDVNLWANYGGVAARGAYVSNSGCAATSGCVVAIGDTANASISTHGGNVDIETGTGGGALAIGSATHTGSIDTGGIGNLTVNANGISQGLGSVNVAGTSTFNAGSSDITLANSGNSFGGPITVNGGGAVELNGTGTLDMDAVANTGSLTLDTASTLNGNITTSAAQTYKDAVTLGADVTLTTTNSAVTFNSTVDNATTTARGLTVSAGTGDVTFDGAVGAGAHGALGDLTLNTSGITRVFDAVQAASFASGTGQTRLYAGVTTTGGDQVWGGTLYLFKPVTLASNGGAITLADVVNQYASSTTLTVDAGNGTVAFNGAVCASGCTMPLGLDVTAAGGISEGSGGVLTVAGASFDAGATGDITLDQANTFTGVVSLTGNATTIKSDALKLGSVDVASLQATTTSGAITQDSTTTLKVTGASTLDAGTNAITLTDAANSFGGSVDVTSGGAVKLAGSTLNIGTIANAASLTLGDAATLYGNITTTGTQTYNGALQLAGDATLTTTNSAVTFTSTVDNATTTARGLTVSAGTGEVTFDGAVGAGPHGALGDLTLNTSGITRVFDAVHAASFSSGTGQTRLYAGITTTGGDQAWNGALYLFKPVTLASGGGAITLADVVNQYPSSTTLTVDAGNGTVAFNGAVCASGCTMPLGLDVTARGGISEGSGGALHIGTSTFDAGSANIELTATNNDVGGVVSLTGGTTRITNAGALILGALDTGNLTVTSSGALNLGSGTVGGTLDATSNNNAITQAGVLAVTGIATLDAGTGNITLTTVGNNFKDVVNLTGATTQLVDTNALTLGTVATGALTASSGDALNLGSGAVTGNLSATSAVDGISQTGALTVTGTSALAATGGAVTLTHTGNDFQGDVTASGDGVSLADTNNLNVTSLTDTNNGNVSLIAGGLLGLAQAINAGTGNITLAANGGSLSTAALTGTNISLTGRDGISLGDNVAAAGTLALTSTDATILQLSGGISVNGVTTITAGTGAVTLTSVLNDFQDTVNLTGGTVQINDFTNLTLGMLDTGNLIVTSGGALGLGSGSITGNLSATSAVGGISQTDALTVTGTSTLAATGGTIALTDSGNDFQGAVTASGDGVSLIDSNDLTITLLTDTNDGDVSLIADGLLGLTQAINAGTGNITLASSGGALNTAALTGYNIMLTGRDGVTLGGPVLAQGALTLASTDAAIQQAGAAITAKGVTTIHAGTGNISLADAGNDFQDAVSLTGGTTHIVDANTLTLGALDTGNLTINNTGALNLGAGTIGGTLSAISNHGAISQTGALTVVGTSTLDAGTANIQLTDTGNDFQHAVNLTGGSTHIVDANTLTLGTLHTGNLTVTSTGALTLGTGTVDGMFSAISNHGAIAQAGALTVTGTSTLDAGTGDITLTDTNNDFQHAVSLTGGATHIVDANTLTLGALDTGNLTISNTGALNLGVGMVDGALSATSDNGMVTQTGALTVTGTSTLDAGTGDIALTDAGNDFQHAVSLTGGITHIVDANTLTLGALDTGNLTISNSGALNLGAGTVDGTLSAISNHGAIAQAGALTVTGTSTLDAGTGSVTLTNALNDFQGGVAGAGAGVSIVDVNNLLIANLTARKNSDIRLIAGGHLTVVGAIDAGTGNITLASNGDALNTAALTGSNIMLTGRDGITLGGPVLAQGALTLASTDAAIQQTGAAITAKGVTTIHAGTGNISLTDTGNDFQDAVNLTGGSAHIVDANTLTLGALDTGNLTINNIGALNLGAGTVGGTLSAISNHGAINQTGALTVVGASTLDAGTANIQLTDTGNDFQGAVAVTGVDVAITDANDLAIAGATISDALTLASGGDITQVAGTIITADTLTGSSVGVTDLSGDNVIVSLGNFSADGFTFTNARALTVATGSTVDGGDSVALVMAGTNQLLQINGRVQGKHVALTSSGAISQGSQGGIKAGILTGSAVQGAQLVGVNTIAAIDDFSADGVTLINARALSIKAGSTVDGGASTTLITTGANGDMTIDGTLKGTVTTLIASGAISEGDQGVLVADTLTGSSVASTHLDGNNKVARLGNFTADGFALTSDPDLTVMVGATVNGQSRTALTTTGAGNDIVINGTVKGTQLALTSSGAIVEGDHGMVQTGTLSGGSVRDTQLDRAAIDSIGRFDAQNFHLTQSRALTVDGRLTVSGDVHLVTTGNGHALTVNGPIQGQVVTLASADDLTVDGAVSGDRVDLRANGLLAINATVNSGNGVTTLVQTGHGDVIGSATGSIVAGVLTGSAEGATRLGSATTFMGNRVDVLGGFSSTAGFSLTNGRTLTLASVNGSAYTVDAGMSDLYLEVRNGDLLQNGTDWLYNGRGTWAASGHIGLASAPIYVKGVDSQHVASIGLPPAYFYAVSRSGDLLPITGASSVNVPVALATSRSQGINGNGGHYIDISAVTAAYRAYGVVQPGVLLPPDQWQCPPQAMTQWCPRGQ